MFDSPAPSGLHRFGGRVRQDWFYRSRPPTNHGPIAEQATGIADKWFMHLAAEQHRSKPRTIHEQVRVSQLARLEPQCPYATGAAHESDNPAQLRLNVKAVRIGLKKRDEPFVVEMVANARQNAWCAVGLS